MSPPKDMSTRDDMSPIEDSIREIGHPTGNLDVYAFKRTRPEECVKTAHPRQIGTPLWR